MHFRKLLNYVYIPPMSASSRTAQLNTNIHTSTLSSALSISTFSLVLLVIRCSKAQCSFVQPGTGWMFFIRHTSKAIKRIVFFQKCLPCMQGSVQMITIYEFNDHIICSYSCFLTFLRINKLSV